MITAVPITLLILSWKFSGLYCQKYFEPRPVYRLDQTINVTAHYCYVRFNYTDSDTEESRYYNRALESKLYPVPDSDNYLAIGDNCLKYYFRKTHTVYFCKSNRIVGRISENYDSDLSVIYKCPNSLKNEIQVSISKLNTKANLVTDKIITYNERFAEYSVGYATSTESSGRHIVFVWDVLAKKPTFDPCTRSLRLGYSWIGNLKKDGFPTYALIKNFLENETYVLQLKEKKEYSCGVFWNTEKDEIILSEALLDSNNLREDSTMLILPTFKNISDDMKIKSENMTLKNNAVYSKEFIIIVVFLIFFIICTMYNIIMNYCTLRKYNKRNNSLRLLYCLNQSLMNRYILYIYHSSTNSWKGVKNVSFKELNNSIESFAEDGLRKEEILKSNNYNKESSGYSGGYLIPDFVGTSKNSTYSYAYQK